MNLDLIAKKICSLCSSIGSQYSICITGDGCAGKTTLSKILKKELFNNCCILEIDDFAIPRIKRKALELTGYSPLAFDFIGFQAACSALKAMKTIFVPCYLHALGASCNNKLCIDAHHYHTRSGSGVLIGVGSFLWINNEYLNWDFKIFMSDNREDCKQKRIQRDVAERGYSIKEVQNHFDFLNIERLKYILPSQKYCEIHIRRVGDSEFVMEMK